MTGIVAAYITCGSHAAARTIARALVEERLAACVNLRPHEAVFRWEGVLEETEEWGLLAKTTQAVLPRLIERVRALHEYACPCIAAWPVADGYGPYFEWVAREVGPAPP